MASFPGFVLCTVLCVMLPFSVFGFCELSPPPSCVSRNSAVVASMSYNGTCIGEPPVVHFEMGSTYELNFTFTPVAKAMEAYNMVEVVLPLGMVIPLDLGQPDACHSLGLSCPLLPHTSYSVRNVFTVEHVPVFSALDATIRWSLLDKRPKVQVKEMTSGTYHDDVIFCISVHARVEPRAGSEEEEEKAQVPHQPQPMFRIVP